MLFYGYNFILSAISALILTIFLLPFNQECRMIIELIAFRSIENILVELKYLAVRQQNLTTNY